MRTLHEVLFQPNATMPAQMMAVLVLFVFPQTLQAALIGPVNVVVFGALPLVFTHWVVRLIGEAPVPGSTRDPQHGFASDVRIGV